MELKKIWVSVTALAWVIICFSPLGWTREGGPRVHDLTPAFLQYWQKYKDQTPQVQIEGFKNEVVPTFPEFYNYKFEKWKRAGFNPDEMLAEEIRGFPKIKDEFEKRAKNLSFELNKNLEIFLRSFDDLNRDFDVYIVHSLGEMDGGGRTIGGKSFFIFGIDGITKYHQGLDNNSPFFHHELFHVYHGQYFTGVSSIWMALWGEGLATYVSAQLNPQAKYQDLLLDNPTGLVRKCEEDMSYLSSLLIGKLDSASEEDYEIFFLLSSKESRVPVRAGYYLGFLVAQEIGKGRSLKELARLNGPELRDEIQKALESIRDRANR